MNVQGLTILTATHDADPTTSRLDSRLRFDPRITVDGVLLATYSVMLDPVLAEEAGVAYAQTVGHEVAHIIQYARVMRDVIQPAYDAEGSRGATAAWNRSQWGDYTGHGRVWREVMEVFGRPAK